MSLTCTGLVTDLLRQKRCLSLINQLFGRCTICQHLRVDAVTAKSAMATPNPAAIVLYSAIIKAGIYPAGFGSEKRKHGKISNSQLSLLANGSLTVQSPVRYLKIVTLE